MIQFIKLCDVKTPQRGTCNSAGVDFFIPEKNEDYVKRFQEKNPTCGMINDNQFFVRAHQRLLIPSGIKVRIPQGTALVAFNKSGVASKLGLDVGASVVDSDYTGEIHLSLINTTDEKIILDFGQKIIQFLLLPVMFDDLEEKNTEEDLYSNFSSARGSGGFGSTGK